MKTLGAPRCLAVLPVVLFFGHVAQASPFQRNDILQLLQQSRSADNIERPATAAVGSSISVFLEVVAQGLTAPLYLTHAGDGSGRLFIVDQIGLVRVVDGSGQLLPAPFLDISSKIPTLNAFFDERGLLGLAFHPEYANNGRFFVRYSAPRAGDPAEPCNDPGGFIVGCHEEILAEYSALGDPLSSNVADPTSEIILFRVDEPQFNHDSGNVAFGPDGLLYWTFGDGGGAHDGLADVPPSHGPLGHGQVTTTALGNVLRIDVDGPPDPGLNYAVPPGNPFAGGGGVPEIYAYGFRNPYRFSFDDGPGGDGSLYVGDVGQNLFEEIDVLPVTAAPGLLNYGWVIREGFDCFDPFNPGAPPAACATTGPFGEPLIDPVMDYDHSVGLAVIGGFVYRGSGVPDLTGKYVFGDFSQDFGPTGRLFHTDITGPQAFQLNEFFLAPNGDPLGQALFGIGEDEDGELYVLASDNIGPTGTAGVIYRIVPPLGACCNDDTGNCTNDVAQLACESNGDRYGGDGATCSTFDPPCLSPPTAVCGDNVRDSGEQCDGPDDANCPGECGSNCRCPAATPAVSEWGLIVLALLLLTGMTYKFGDRRPKRVRQG